jgi:CubicO group peptidase (beta-lactamase class C family)
MEIETTFIERLKDLLDRQSVIGASLAFVNDGTVSVAAAGVKDVATGAPVDVHTVFDAASLTKPLIAYAVLQLCDKGILDLDDPLAECVRPVIPDDPLAARITVRHILTHTCGLQNLRGKEPLRMFFKPGTRFSYSSVGYMYLQLAIEAKTGEPLETTLRRLVFEPLGMHSSSLEWREAFAVNEAIPH